VIPELTDGETVSVIGPVSSGKTFLVKKWLEKIAKRFVVFDPTAEYDDIPGVHFWATPKSYAMYLRDNPHEFRAIYHPQDVETGFTTVASGIWQMDASESKWLFIEEIHELISPWSKHEKMRILMKYARKRLIGMVGVTQAIADLHKDFTRASRMVILFNTHESRDLDAIEERWGKEARSTVENLRALIYRDETQTTEQIPEALVIKRGDNPPHNHVEAME
jgi:DNA helicase HerA-like ATPase